jgi:hypothetical protein
MLRSEAAVGGVIRLSTVTKAEVSRPVRLTDAPKHPQIGLEQGKQTFCPLLVHLTARIFLLGMIHECVPVALQGAIAARRVRVEATARVHRDVGCLLDRLDRAIAGRLDDDCSLATDPGENGGSGFVIMPPTGVALLAAPTWPTTQVLFPAGRWPASSTLAIACSGGGGGA